MDVMLYYFSDESIREAAIKKADDVRRAYEQLCTDDVQFLNSIEQTTKSMVSVTDRFKKWAEILSNCVAIPVKSPF